MEEATETATYISCLAWIHKGYAAKVPKEIELTEEEVAQMKADPMVAEGLMEQEDEEDDLPVFGDNVAEMINANSQYPLAVEELSDEQKEDYYIKDTDALIVAGKVEKQYASLQVYVYEQQTNNLFVHHEIMMSAFPLDIEWLRVSLGSINSGSPAKGNYAIVGSFLPEIQIWNLDLTEAIQPDLLLGGEAEPPKKKPKKFTNQQKKYRPGSHTDAVTSLSLNHSNLSVLASGSIDASFKVWDIGKATCVHTAPFGAPLRKVEWNALDVSVLFASTDKKIGVLDSRFPSDCIWHQPGEKEEIESACWNVNNQSQIVYSTTAGNIHLFDVRKSHQLLASAQAHSSRANDVKTALHNLCFSCGEDQTVRVWDLNDFSQPLAAKNPKKGIMMCLDVLEENEGPVLSAGNSQGQLFVWDVTENKQVENHWKTH